MSTEARPRSTRDGERGQRGSNGRGYRAYTSGANALRVDRVFGADDVDEGSHALLPHPAAREDFDTPSTRRRTTGRPETAAPQPWRVPRPRGRTPWVSDITPLPEPEALPLPLTLPKAPFLLLMVGLVVVGIVGVLVLHTKINEGSFRLSDLQATQAALDLQEQQLEQQLADLSSPNNLRAAATRLGLVPAGTPAFITLPDGRVVGVPQPATGR